MYFFATYPVELSISGLKIVKNLHLNNLSDFAFVKLRTDDFDTLFCQFLTRIFLNQSNIT